MAPLDAISQVCGKLHCFLQHARLASVLQDASADFLNREKTPRVTPTPPLRANTGL